MPNAFPPRADGRWIALAILIAFLLLLKVAAVLLGKPVFELPPFTWIGPMAPYFADLRGVASWSDQFLADPSLPVSSLRDPWNRPFNYHHWWLYIGRLGLDSGTVMGFGYGMGLLFFVSCFFALGKLDAFGGLVSGLFLISYAVMFGLERANVDLLIFVLIALALELRRIPCLSVLIIALAAILKLHPLFAFLALVTPPWRKNLPWLGVGLLVFALGLGVYLHEFMANMSSAPNMRSGALSFGMTTLGVEFMDRFQLPDLYPEVVATGCAALILALGIGASIRPRLKAVLLDEREVYAFRMGAGIYIGSFALGTNHDYRAIFLFFCLPLLFRFVRKRLNLGWTWTTLSLILVYVNWLYLMGEWNWPDFVLKQVVAWALLGCLTGLCVASLPPALQWPRRTAIRL